MLIRPPTAWTRKSYPGQVFPPSTAEAGDGGVDDARVFYRDLVIAQALPFQGASAVVLQQDVRPPRQLPRQLQILRIGKVELYRLLAPVGGIEVGA